MQYECKTKRWQKIYCAQTMLCEVKIADYGTKTNKHFTLQ